MLEQRLDVIPMLVLGQLAHLRLDLIRAAVLSNSAHATCRGWR